MEEIRFLLYTIAIELPIAIVFLPKVDRKKGCFVVLLVNMITHPIAWQLVSARVSWEVVEVGVALFEAGIFALFFPTVRIRAAMGAVTANVVTAFIGKVLF